MPGPRNRPGLTPGWNWVQTNPYQPPRPGSQYGYGGGLGSYPSTQQSGGGGLWGRAASLLPATSTAPATPATPEEEEVPGTGGGGGGGFNWQNLIYTNPKTGNSYIPWSTQQAMGLSQANVDNIMAGKDPGAFNTYNVPTMSGTGYNSASRAEWFEVGAGGNIGLNPFGAKRGRDVSVSGVTPNPNNPAGYGGHSYGTHDRPSKHKQSPQGMERFPWMGTGGGASGATTAPGWLVPMTMWRPRG